MKSSLFFGAIFAQAITSSMLHAADPQVLGPYTIGGLLHEDDFENSAVSTGKWDVQLENGSDTVTFHNGVMEAENPNGGCTIWFTNELSGPVVITYTATMMADVRISDLNCFWMATDPVDNSILEKSGAFDAYHKLHMYYVGYGGGNNSTCRMRRYPRENAAGSNVPHVFLNAYDNNPDYLLEEGQGDQTYHVQLVAYDDLVQYIINGVLVYEMKNGQTVNLAEGASTIVGTDVLSDAAYPPYTQGYFGFRGTQNHVRYDDFKVHRLEPGTTPPSDPDADITDFDSTNPGPEMPLTDGNGSGFSSQPGGGGGDTMAGWTWYTFHSSTHPISVPYKNPALGVGVGGTAAVGEQEIRSGANLEINFTGLPTSRFNLRYGDYRPTHPSSPVVIPIALRRTFTGVGAGTANVDWEDNTLGGFFAYYSQNGGGTWTELTDGADFTATAGDLDVLFVGNDGADSSGSGNEGLQSVTVTYGSGPDATAPLLSSTDPADGATNVATTASLDATFDEDIALTGSGGITIRNLSGGADIPVTLPDDVSIDGAALTITPATGFAEGEEYAVEISSDAIEDLAGNDHPGILATDDPNWSFTIASGEGGSFSSSFNSDPTGPNMPLTDGYLSGWGTPLGIIGAGDTFAGWTWYTAQSTTNTIMVPFGGGTATVGEQAIRSGTGLEINFTGSPTSKFNLRWGATTAIALRRTFTGVPEGWAEVDWTADAMEGFFAYASQDGGTTWRPIYSGFSFEVIAADLDVVFVGNDGANSSTTENSGLYSVTVTYPAEPGDPYQPNQDITVDALIADGVERPFRQAVVRITRSGGTGAPRTLNYTLGGDAIEGTDYPTQFGTVTIPIHASSIDVRIAPIDDATAGAVEALSFDLEGAPPPVDLRIADRPFALFQADHPGAGHAEDDVDADGDSTLAEYFFGTHPLANNPTPLARSISKDESGLWLLYSYPENPAATDARLGLATSESMAPGSWQNVPLAPRVSGFDPATGNRLREGEVLTPESATRGFYRFEVSILPDPPEVAYDERVRRCLDLLIEHGTDRYGPVHTPTLVSILDVETLECPQDPERLEENWRADRRGRRSPAGSNFFFDLPLLDTMRLVSAETGDAKYRDFADNYLGWAMDNQLNTQSDRLGMFWWGWHRFYNVFDESKRGFTNTEAPTVGGGFHEIHQMHCIDWEKLWEIDPAAVQNEIEMIWNWHVVDKTVGRVNRHDTIEPFINGSNLPMAVGSFIQAFSFLHTKVGGTLWLDRAKLVMNLHWDQRNTTTNLVPDATHLHGLDRWPKDHFTTASVGHHVHGLLKAYELTGDTDFRDRAVAYLKAYGIYGYDAANESFWGMLKLDGTPVTAPRLTSGYDGYQPRGHLDLWQPYAAGFEYPMYAAMAYAYGYKISGDPDLLVTARRFATFIENNLPPEQSRTATWYDTYSSNYARFGTHASNYAHLVSFFLNLYLLTGEQPYLDRATEQADEAIAKLEHKGLFKGHPAKPYYENLDGVGFLLYAFMQLDAVLEDPGKAVATRTLDAGSGDTAVPIDFDNW